MFPPLVRVTWSPDGYWLVPDPRARRIRSFAPNVLEPVVAGV